MYIFSIKTIRQRNNMTLYELSKRTGISRTYLRNLENNRCFNPTMFILEKIAEVLQVNIKDLFYSPYEIDTLKEEMYRRIEEYGIGSKEVMEVSQIIDLLINIKLKKE